MRRKHSELGPLFLAGLFIVGCGDDAVAPDAGASDSGPRLDGSESFDTGTRDAGMGVDATPRPDLGGDGDASSPDLGGPDGGPVDLGGLDAGETNGSGAIAAARSAPDGVTNLLLNQVYVTYVKPEVGLDSAGFFVQADRLGPALFVASTASVAVGDELSFRITEMATRDQQRRAIAISDLLVLNSSFDVSTLSQDLSSASNVTQNVADYESEIVIVTASITQAPGNGGLGHRGMDIDTAGLQDDPNFELRIPNELSDQLGLEVGCVFTVAHTPLWRFSAKAQVSAWTIDDFAGIQCPSTVLQSVVSTSPSEVAFTFSRLLDPTSVVDPATQILFDNGLIAIDATVVGNLLLVTTSAQSPGLRYSATVGSGLRDLLGGAIEADGGFDGFLTYATLRINELSAVIASGCDLVELRVIEGGSIDGYTFRERTDLQFTLPSNLIVNTNDYIVLHFNAGNPNCIDPGAANEITGPDQFPNASFPLNFDAGYDLYTNLDGLVMTNNVFTLLGPGNVIVDALFATTATTGNTAAGTETQAATVANASEWEMVSGGVPVNGFVDDDFHPHAVQGLGISNRVLSIQRLSDLDTNTKADWTATATTSSWGLNNAGQQDL